MSTATRVRARKTEVEEQPSSLSPAEVVQALHDSGTPIRVVRSLREWLGNNEEATPETLYLHMVELEKTNALNVGTLRKAGKLIHGNTFEPDCLVKMAPADELLRLREENDRLTERVTEQASRILGLTNQVTHLQERLNDANHTISFLRIGKSKEDLAAAGLNPPVAEQ